MIDYITTTEAARIIGVRRRHVVKLFHAGLLCGQWFGGVIQIERASAAAYRPSRDHGHGIERMQPYAKTIGVYLSGLSAVKKETT